MRAPILWAVALRDLSMELAGKRGRLMPLVAAVILLPMGAAPVISPESIRPDEYHVTGEVPPEVLALDNVEEDPSSAVLRFFPPTEETPAYRLRGDFVPGDIRDAMDARDPRIDTEVFARPPLAVPSRSLFIALVSASILTGAITSSIPGERTAKTLVSLATAAISRRELVWGKWLAWAGFGSLCAWLATCLTLLLGRQAPGMWLLSMPMVSAGTVALGLFMVRNATDVVGGATVALRVLPAALTILGLGAYGLGTIDPYLGAALPLGGALVASGDTWPGWGPPLLSILTTLLASAALLEATSRAIDGEPNASLESSLLRGASLSALTALIWWLPLLAPLVWAAGGNRTVIQTLDPAVAVLTSATGCMLLWTVVKATETVTPPAPPTPRARHLVLGVLAGALLAAVIPVQPMPDASLHARWFSALQPAWAGLLPFLLAVIAQELIFRGLLARFLPDAVNVALFALVVTPTAPLHGAVVGSLMLLLTRASGGSLWPAFLARLAWAVAPIGLMAAPAWMWLPLLAAWTPLGWARWRQDPA